MNVHRVKARRIAGTQWSEVLKSAMDLYKHIHRRSKRRPYVRSAYFQKEKIFLDYFWRHVHEKANFRDKIRRVKLYPCALELIQQTRFDPDTKEHPHDRSHLLHRFHGQTPDGALFIVQIKQDKRTNEKWFLSVFPCK